MRFGAPHRIEAGVERLLVIAGVITVDAHAGGGHAKDDGGAAIEERVERDEDVLDLIGAVAPPERRLDAAVAAVHARADIEGVIVVGEPHLHGIGRRRAFGRLFLDEVGDRRRPSARLRRRAGRRRESIRSARASRSPACGSQEPTIGSSEQRRRRRRAGAEEPQRHRLHRRETTARGRPTAVAQPAKAENECHHAQICHSFSCLRWLATRPAKPGADRGLSC